ncbi:aldehyde dehydrogenase [Bacillus tianshenii]|nr:aldehyde dehydrogenase [Bacillus tianshenii]
MVVKTLIDKQRTYFYEGHTNSAAWRIKQLKKLRKNIKKFEKKIIDALWMDLHKSEMEAYTTEIGILYEEIKFIEDHLKDWVKPEKVKTPLTHFGSKSEIHFEPYGVVGIIAPWNYPFQLAIAPLIGAIAAGNCAIVKPSELTPHVSTVIASLLRETYSEDFVAVIEGGVSTSQALLSEKLDYVFFTGSVAVGKIVMEACAKNLTPVTLELGGKSPVIVDKDAKIDLAAKRIAWGKFLNAGQTCIAPDYLYVHEKVKDKLLASIKKYIVEFYGENPLKSEKYGHIVNEKHFKRLVGYLNDGTISYGGTYEMESLAIAPTILEHTALDAPVMKDEIFGPILPVFPFEKIEDVIEGVRSREKPLALYLFTESKKQQDKIVEKLSFGGGAMNDTIFHIATPYLPFGGVGESGMGSYHGKYSFETFSHRKSVLTQTTAFDFAFRYPSSKNGLKIIRKLFKG